MRLTVLIAALALAVTAVWPQVMLPARRIVAPTSITDTNPPFSGDLAFWLWAKSFEGQSEGATVTNWPDLTGNGNHFTNYVAGTNNPTFTTNGVSTNTPYAVLFNVTNNTYLAQTSGSQSWWTNGSAFHNFFVLKVKPSVYNPSSFIQPGGLHTWTPIDGSNNRSQNTYTNRGGDFNTRFGTYADNAQQTYVIVATSMPYAPTDWRRINSYTASGDYAFHIDEIPLFSTNVNTVAFDNMTVAGSQIGHSVWRNGANSTDYYYNGWMTEVLMYRRKLSDSERVEVDTWLAEKYGLTVIPYPTPGNAVFDGSNDYIRMVSSGPTGLADGKQFTISQWVRFDGANADTRVLLTFGANPYLQVYKNTSNKIVVDAWNSAGVKILGVTGSTSLTTGSGWVHLYMCFDLTDTAKRKIYVNGVAETLVVGTYTDDTINFVATNQNYTFAAGNDTTLRLFASCEEFWFDDSYLDDPGSFASGGCPISLGPNGEDPTGSSPVFYLQYQGNGFSLNSGTGGNFTVVGALGTTTAPCP